MSRLLPLLAIVFSIALFFVYIRPTYTGTIHEKKQQIASYDSALVAASHFEQKEAELTQAESNIPSDSLERLKEFLPDGVDNVQLILDLDALAARSGITLSNFDVKNQDGSSPSSVANTTSATAGSSNLSLAASSPVDSIDLTFSATGSYASFRTFLAGIENSLRPLDVVSVMINDSATGIYTYTMTVRIYWLR